MRKAELDAILERDSGPIEPHLAALAIEPLLPHLAVALCVARIEEAAPALLAALERAADGAALGENEERLLFRGVHILGAARRPEAFSPLMRLLSRPAWETEELLGDAVTENVAGIIAGVFNGDAAALFALIEDMDLDEFLRSAVLGAATFLTWDRRIETDVMVTFLRRFHDARAAELDDVVWDAWGQAIACLGLSELYERARAMMRDGPISDFGMDLNDFERLLLATECDDPARFQHNNLGYIEDVIVALEKFSSGGADLDFGWAAPAMPIRNPWRGVGRNDPCPCGSGRKFKTCCRAEPGSNST